MTELIVQVGASTDDCKRGITQAYFTLTATDTLVGRVTATTQNKRGIGLRFTNITIPQGSTILTAYLTVIASSVDIKTAVNSRISAEQVDDAPTFADDAVVFDARWANRGAQVDWDNIEGFTDVQDPYNSPDIASVIQYIVNRAGWASGQDIVIFWEDFEDRSSGVEQDLMRQGYAWDGNPSLAIKLTITYAEPVTGMKGLNPALMELLGY